MTDNHRIFIYCDDASHDKRVAVENFVYQLAASSKLSSSFRKRLDRDRGGDPVDPAVQGYWVTQSMTRQKRRRRGSQRMYEDRPVRDASLGPEGQIRFRDEQSGRWVEVARDDEAYRRTLAQLQGDREVFPLGCRKCPNRSLPLRREKLDRVLDAARRAGMSELSLVDIGAILEEQSTSMRRVSGAEEG